MQNGRKYHAHVCLKKTREGRLQCQETQSQSQAAARSHSGLCAAQHAGSVQLRTTSDLWKMTGNGKLPAKHSWPGWALPRGQSGFTPACHRPSRSQRNACFQRKLPDSWRRTPSLAHRHPSLPVRERGGYPQLALHPRVNKDPSGPSYHKSEQVQGGFPTAAHGLQGREVSERCWGA